MKQFFFFLTGSNYSSSYFSHYIGKVCSSSYPRSYITYDKYVQLEFDRNVGSNYHRGFVAGYIAFCKWNDVPDLEDLVFHSIIIHELSWISKISKHMLEISLNFVLEIYIYTSVVVPEIIRGPRH